MVRKFVWLLVAIVVTCGVSDLVSCPESPVGWTITNPVKDNLYNGSIAGAGQATSAENFIVKVVSRAVTSTVYAENNGTSTCGEWQKDVPEPQGGWLQNTEAAFEIWLGSTMKESVDIMIN